MEEKVLEKLKAMEFKENSDKPGLYAKPVDGGFAHWDFRRAKNGRFFVSIDGQGFEDDKESKLRPEYLAMRELTGGSTATLVEEKPVKKPEDKKQALSVLERKDQAFDLMNRRDDEQVLLEIQGGFLEEFVYSFPTKEGKVTGLSWVGTKEVARQMGNISVEDCDILETPDTYRVKCRAKDIQRNVTMFGVAEQAKRMKLKTGEEIPDLHAMSKAVSRAQRNAIRGLIPEIFIKKMIEQYIQDKE